MKMLMCSVRFCGGALLVLLLFSPISLVAETISAREEKIIAHYEALLKRDSRSVLAREHIAEAKMSMARATGNETLFADAEKLLRQAEKLSSQRSAKRDVLLAKVVMARHAFGDALEIIEKLDATKEVHILAKGDAHLGLGQYREARKLFKKAFEKGLSFSSAVRRAHIEGLYGSEEELPLLRLAKSLYSGAALEPLAWIELRIGIYHLTRGELDRAEEQFLQSLQVAPDYYLAQEHLAEVYELRGENEKARPLLEQAIQTKRDPALLLRLGKLSTTEERVKLQLEAESVLQYQAEQSNAHARDYAEFLFDEKQDVVKALRYAEQDAQLRPGDIQTNLLLARIHHRLGKVEEASVFAKRAMRLGNLSDEEHVMLAWYRDLASPSSSSGEL